MTQTAIQLNFCFFNELCLLSGLAWPWKGALGKYASRRGGSVGRASNRSQSGATLPADVGSSRAICRHQISTRFRNVERKKSMHRYIWPLQDGDVTIHADICWRGVKYWCFIRNIIVGLVRHCAEVVDKPLVQLSQVRIPALFFSKRKCWIRMSINKAHPVFIKGVILKLVLKNKVRI